MQIVNKGVHRKQETRIHQISLLMKYSFANEGQILDSYAFEGISKIVMEIHDPRWQSSASIIKIVCSFKARMKPIIYSVDPAVLNRIGSWFRIIV